MKRIPKTGGKKKKKKKNHLIQLPGKGTIVVGEKREEIIPPESKRSSLYKNTSVVV
jgi:hypothetical protein